MSRRMRIALLAVVTALAWSATATASGSSLIDQYVEDVPTSGGSHYPGASSGASSGGGGGVSSVTPVPLSGSAQTSLNRKGGQDAKALAKIATSPQYGAPVVSADGKLQPATTPSAVDAAVSAVGNGGGKSVGFLIALLAATAVAIVGLVARRRTN